jgi:hypothetical protein
MPVRAHHERATIGVPQLNGHVDRGEPEFQQVGRTEVPRLMQPAIVGRPNAARTGFHSPSPYEGDTPIALATSWFSGVLRAYWDEHGELTPSALAKTDSIPEGTGPYVERITGHNMTTAKDRLAARLASADGREQLQTDPPCATQIDRVGKALLSI